MADFREKGEIEGKISIFRSYTKFRLLYWSLDMVKYRYNRLAPFPISLGLFRELQDKKWTKMVEKLTKLHPPPNESFATLLVPRHPQWLLIIFWF